MTVPSTFVYLPQRYELIFRQVKTTKGASTFRDSLTFFVIFRRLTILTPFRLVVCQSILSKMSPATEPNEEALRKLLNHYSYVILRVSKNKVLKSLCPVSKVEIRCLTSLILVIHEVPSYPTTNNVLLVGL